MIIHGQPVNNEILSIQKSIADNLQNKHLFSSTIATTMNDKDKYDRLCESQMYFHKKYSKATPFQLNMLKKTNKLRYNLFMVKKLFKKR